MAESTKSKPGRRLKQQFFAIIRIDVFAMDGRPEDYISVVSVTTDFATAKQETTRLNALASSRRIKARYFWQATRLKT